MASPLQIIFLLIHDEFAAPLFLAYFTVRAFLFLISKMKPITKWKTTPNIKTGCSAYCTRGLVPIKWERSLNISALKIEVTLIAKCCSKKNIRKKAESAMANFLAIEEFKIPLILISFILKQR